MVNYQCTTRLLFKWTALETSEDDETGEDSQEKEK